MKQPRNLISSLPRNESQRLSHPIFFNRNWPKVGTKPQIVHRSCPKVSGNKTAHKAPHKSCVVVFHTVCRNWLVIEGQRSGKTREKPRDRQRKRKRKTKKKKKEGKKRQNRNGNSRCRDGQWLGPISPEGGFWKMTVGRRKNGEARLLTVH